MTDLESAEIRRSPILAHYATGYEAARLETGSGKLERARTEEIVARYLPPPPSLVLDVGGGPGHYATWLAAQGFAVRLLDLVPLHVELARQRFEVMGCATARAEVGDARSLPYADETADAALLLGPLYHLPAREDRLAALREARRVLRPGSPVVVAGISRFASLLDGFFRDFMGDPDFVGIVDRDLGSGRHENPTPNPLYFTSAYFHRPDELVEELEDAGLVDCTVLAVEGPFWCLHDFDAAWSSADLRTHMLRYLREIERERSLIGASAHLLAIGRRPV